MAPGWVDTPLIEGWLDNPKEMYREAWATVPLRKTAKPTDVARVIAFLTSHSAAGHISGEYISIDGGMEVQAVWSESETLQGEKASSGTTEATARSKTTTPQSLSPATKSRPSIKIAIPVGFDAVSGWLGTGASPENNLSEYSSAYFSAYVGVLRLLKLFIKPGIADKITWFVPIHFAESFSEQFKATLNYGCELGCMDTATRALPS